MLSCARHPFGELLSSPQAPAGSGAPKQLLCFQVVKLSRQGEEPLGVDFDKMDPEVSEEPYGQCRKPACAQNLMVSKLAPPGLVSTYNQQVDSERAVHGSNCPLLHFVPELLIRSAPAIG